MRVAPHVVLTADHTETPEFSRMAEALAGQMNVRVRLSILVILLAALH